MRQVIKDIIFFTIYLCLIIGNCAYGQTKLSDTIHFYSIVDKVQFDTLSGSDFSWEIFKPINDTISYTLFHKRPVFIQSLSTKRKVLFYTWELERAVMGESGFANFYYNYKSYFKETIKALTILNDTAMLNVLNGVNKVYLTHGKQINQSYKHGDWKYTNRQFSFYDKAYINRHEHTMKLLEDFIRLYPEEFVRFK